MLKLSAGRIGLALVVSAAAAAAAAAQPPSGPPPRDRMPATGTGSVYGRVVDGTTGAPVARARVRIQTAGGPRPVVMTAGDGGFAFKGLPRGPFSIAVDKATYLSATHPEGGRTLRSRLRPRVLGDGESIDDITIRLSRSGAITGRVVDVHGDPIEYAEVRVMRVSGTSGRPSMASGSGTNDIGEFRAGRLEPGSYILMASGRRSGPDEISLPTTPGASPAAPLPTYYPGVISIDQAQPIRVERGQTVSDVEITLVEGVSAIVSGSIVGEDGQPFNAGFVTARAVLRDRQMMGMDSGGASVRQDGTFRMQVPPGEYLFEARGMMRPATPPAGSQVLAAPRPEQFGLARVLVSGNIEGLVITIGSGATATGRVVFEGNIPPPPLPTGQFRLPLMSADGVVCRQGQVSVQPDWTFRVDGLAGTCSGSGQVGFGPWVVKSVTVGGQELLHESITFEAGQRLRDVQVVFTDRRGSINFTVTDGSGRPTTEYAAIAVPVTQGPPPLNAVRPFVPPDPATLALMSSMRAQAPADARPTSPTTLNGLAAGEYYVIAIDDIGVEEFRDAGVLARLVGAATRVTVGDTPVTEVSLRRQALADLLRR